MKTYNKKQAEILVQDFTELQNIDLYATDRKTRNVVLRTLFYKVLIDKNNMNDREISEFFKEKDVKRERSSIYHALGKVDLYYETYDYFRKAYDLYFDDKLEIHNKIKEKQIRLYNKNKKVSDKIVPKNDKDELQAIIDTLTGSKRAEVLELVRLRVKSWEWKSKDQCEIITCSENISDFVY
jgi:hypothetical protein